MDVYFFIRGFAYAQSLLWILLLRSKRLESFFTMNAKKYFLILSSVVLIYVKVFDIFYNHYTTELILFYIYAVMIVTFIFDIKMNFKDALCYGFIVVFINSYYWESMLHLNKIIYYGINFNDFIQSLHIYTAYLFYREIEITNMISFKKMFMWGLVFSTLNVLIRGIIPIDIYGLIGGNATNNHITRILCLGILVLNIYNNTKKRDKDIIS